MGLSFILESEAKELIGSRQLTALQECYSEYFPALKTKQFEIEVNLFSNLEMQELNLASRNLDYPTDVLSFPLHSSLQTAANTVVEPVLLGTVVIAPQIANLQGDSLIDLLHHGCFHLFGFDHESNRVEWDTEESAMIILAKKYQLSLIGIPPALND